jgi:glyoxylase-like metal-dependent hydrolase (beta-lactamase superfamily II)
MKVICLKANKLKYTCNAYLVLGSWNTLDDVNTLVDVGTDGSIIQEIEEINTGVGKTPVQQIVITHEHFDHAGGIREIKSWCDVKVYACKRFDGVDEILTDGQIIRMGDRDFEVIHVPEHSSDSICLYCREEGIFFSGDTPLRIMSSGGTYCREFTSVVERLTKLTITSIYSGHDKPVENNIGKMLDATLKNIKIGAVGAACSHPQSGIDGKVRIQD